MAARNKYSSNGVFVTPISISVGDKVRVAYDGLLAKSGASEIFAHVGYGNKWDDSTDLKMSRTTTGFEATIPVTYSTSLNLCFKDNADNWDNNSGKNYTFDVTD